MVAHYFTFRFRREVWHLVAAVSGASAIGLGAYGAHGFKPSKPENLKVFERGVEYHLAHTALIALAPLARRPNVVRKQQQSSSKCYS